MLVMSEKIVIRVIDQRHRTSWGRIILFAVVGFVLAVKLLPAPAPTPVPATYGPVDSAASQDDWQQTLQRAEQAGARKFP